MEFYRLVVLQTSAGVQSTDTWFRTTSTVLRFYTTCFIEHW